MPKPLRTRPVSTVQVRAYAAKAQEYADAAVAEITAGRYIAATSLAIHAAINAADAVCGARLDERAAGEAHQKALDLLRTAGSEGAAVEKELHRLLPLKTKAEYEPDNVAIGVATKSSRTRAAMRRDRASCRRQYTVRATDPASGHTGSPKRRTAASL